MWNSWVIELHRNRCGQAVLQCRPTSTPPMEAISLLSRPVHHLLCLHTRRIGDRLHRAQQDRPIRKGKSDLRFPPDHQRPHGIIAVCHRPLPCLEEEDEAADEATEVDEAVEEEAEATEEESLEVADIEVAFRPHNSGMLGNPMKSGDKSNCKHR